MNLKTRTETKQPEISGYAHNEEICFIGKDKIVAMGNPVMTKNSEYNVWNKINLKTAKATKQWDDRSKEEKYSNHEWSVYKEKKKGTAKITVTCNGVKKVFTVKVK